MSILTKIFQMREDRAATRALAAQFDAAETAISSSDVETVRKIAANTVFSQRQITALVLKAIDRDDTGVFDAVLHGKNVKGNPNEMVRFHSPLMPDCPHHYSESSMLYLAINSDKSNVAVALATNPKTDITKSGYSESSVYHSGGFLGGGGHTESNKETYPSPLERAREMNMTEVMVPLARRTAEVKQKEAAALQKEARALAP